MMIRRIGNAIGILLGTALAPSLLFAVQQTLTLNIETEVYQLKYDDQRISTEEMKQCMLLALHYTPDTTTPYLIASSETRKNGKLIFGKWFMSLSIENCNPGYDECKNQQLNDKFFDNAEQNLQTSARQLKDLRSMRIPEVLNPVRSYLAWSLEITTKMEQARFEYLKTGDPNALAQVECSICHCQDQGALLRELNMPIKHKVSWARNTWHNRVNKCVNAHDPGYPIEAWQRFLKQFGVHEKFVQVGVP